MKFLRHHHTRKNIFVYPEVDDTQIVSKDMIVKRGVDLIPLTRFCREWRVRGFAPFEWTLMTDLESLFAVVCVISHCNCFLNYRDCTSSEACLVWCKLRMLFLFGWGFFFSYSLRNLCANEGPFLKMSPIVEDLGWGGGGVDGTVYYQTNVHDILMISCIN